MKTFNHTKLPLAKAVARNASKLTGQAFFVMYAAIKSVSTMKLADTTVILIIPKKDIFYHCCFSTSIILFYFEKGIQKPIN